MIDIKSLWLLVGLSASVQACPVHVSVEPKNNDVLVVSIDNISSQDLDILYDFLPWSVFGFGINYSAKYREAKTEIRPIYAFGHRSEIVVLKANTSMQQEVSLYKRFNDLKSDAGVVDVAWVYRFPEPGKGTEGCAQFKGQFSIFETPTKRTSE
ncbi:MAG: hypothetical protein ACN6O1_12210 [Comamonas sp.]|uniref:hypothetical protein n=1 Tax=Comamonas sp. TaxID=34028 RepID=UPI003D11A83C